MSQSEPIRIGIVEDEIIIADDMQLLLQSLGYQVPDPCCTYEEAVTMLRTEQLDLMVLDINLNDDLDGVDVARYIRANFDMPFIFLTANSDKATITRARYTNPDAYLIKPFDKSDLYAAIEIAIHNFNRPSRPAQPGSPAGPPMFRTSVFVKDDDYFQKVNYDDILYLESEHVYVAIHTDYRKFMVRATMQDYLGNLDPATFVRVHRSYVVNLSKIDKINTSTIIVQGFEIPVSKNYRDELLKLLGIN